MTHHSDQCLDTITDSDKVAIERLLIKSAALLLLFGLLTGFYLSAIAMKLVSADFGMALAAHLNALLGSFWILGVSYSLRHCHLSPVLLKRMSVLIIIANYANWIFTAIKAYLNVSAISWVEGHLSNNLILVSLTLFVVIPALTGTLLWVFALFKDQPKTT